VSLYPSPLSHSNSFLSRSLLINLSLRGQAVVENQELLISIPLSIKGRFDLNIMTLVEAGILDQPGS